MKICALELDIREALTQLPTDSDAFRRLARHCDDIAFAVDEHFDAIFESDRKQDRPPKAQHLLDKVRADIKEGVSPPISDAEATRRGYGHHSTWKRLATEHEDVSEYRQAGIDLAIEIDAKRTIPIRTMNGGFEEATAIVTLPRDYREALEGHEHAKEIAEILAR